MKKPDRLQNNYTIVAKKKMLRGVTFKGEFIQFVFLYVVSPNFHVKDLECFESQVKSYHYLKALRV